MVSAVKSDNIKVLCFDPGITTGWAIGYITDTEFQVGVGQDKWEVWELHKFLVDQKPNHVIYERFEHRNRARAGLEYFSRELIGIMRLYINDNLETTIEHARMPGQNWDYFTNRRLKEMELYKPGKPHAMDALRHMLGWWEFGYGYQWHAGRKLVTL